eukprot:SAG11_NODE_3701_length_2270_cov_240.098111_3_plen_273_part_00
MTAYSGYGIVSYSSTVEMSQESEDLMALSVAEPEPELERLYPETPALSRRVRCIQTYFRGRMARRRVNQIRHDLLTPAEQALIEADLELRHFTVNVKVSFYPSSFYPDQNFDLNLHSLVNEAGLMAVISRKMARILVEDDTQEEDYGISYESGEYHVTTIKITGPSVFWKCMNRGLLVWDFKAIRDGSYASANNRTNFELYVQHLASQQSSQNVKKYITVGTDGLQHLCVECKESVGIYTMDNGGMLCYNCMKQESYQWVRDFLTRLSTTRI